MRRGEARADPTTGQERAAATPRVEIGTGVTWRRPRSAASGSMGVLTGAGRRRTSGAGARPRRPRRAAGALALASLFCASLARASDPASAADPTVVRYERRIDFGDRAVAMRVVTDRTKPGAAELGAHYDVATETERLPGLDLAAIVGVSSAIATEGAEPGVRATARKTLGPGTPIEALTLQSEVRSPSLTDDAGRWRAALGASLRLGPETHGTVDVVREQPLGCATRNAVAAAATQAQVGMEHRIAPLTDVVVGAALGQGRDLRSLSGTVGFVHRF